MARYKHYEQNQGLFLNLHLAEQFDEYSLEKVIDKFVEKKVEQAIFAAGYVNDNRGQAAYDPKPLLKVIFYSFAKGITQSRKIEELLKKHISYIYLSGHQVFDHSTICKFINLHAQGIGESFSKLLCVLNQLKLIDWSIVETDGTLVSANASKTLTGKKRDFERIMERCRKYSKKLIERSQSLSSQKVSEEVIEEEERKIKRQKKVYQRIMEKIEDWEKQVAAGEISADKKTNLTDKESSLFKQGDNRGYLQGHNMQCSFSNNDILLPIAVGEHKDSQTLEETMASLNDLKRRLEVEEKSSHIMDKGFFCATTVCQLLKEEEDIIIPIPDTVKERKTIFKEGKCYLEYEGEWLLGTHDKRNDRYRFHCKDANNKKREFAVMAVFAENRELWDSYRQKIGSKEGKSLYAKRIGKEHNHHTLKEIGGMRRIDRRGKAKAVLEGLLHGIGYNLRKLSKQLNEKNLVWEPC